MVRRSLRHLVTALALLVAFVCQETWALAGVTGGLTGSVIDADSSAPVAGAQVTATSPSQSATTTTDAAGHFGFLTLAPDTYTVTVSKSGYQPMSVPGQVVFADTVQSVPVRVTKTLRTIARVTSTRGQRFGKVGYDGRRLLDQRSTQAATAALGRRRPYQSGVFGDLDGSGRLRHPEPKRLLRDSQHPRRRLRSSRLRVRRRSGQSLVR